MCGSREYDEKIDIWSLGCTLAELILHQPIFPGQTDINQLDLIFRAIGYPVHIVYYTCLVKALVKGKIVAILFVVCSVGGRDKVVEYIAWCGALTGWFNW